MFIDRVFFLQKDRLTHLRREAAREEFENMNMVSKNKTTDKILLIICHPKRDQHCWVAQSYSWIMSVWSRGQLILRSRNIQFEFSGMTTITAPRQFHVSFSYPIFPRSWVFLTYKDWGVILRFYIFWFCRGIFEEYILQTIKQEGRSVVDF